ncbi:MAG: B12-binding domain-containing radical SAM protein, partial [Candidatus Hydrothermarchaeota archaeon]
DVATVGAIKAAFPQTHVVMVGAHATAEPEEVLNLNPQIDAVARGEFDVTAIELAQAIAQNRDWHIVAGLSFRQQAEIIHTAERALIGDLDQFPFVSQIYRDFLEVKDYFFAAAQYPMVMLVTSRGCPHRCQWCLYPQVMHRGKYRLRSSESVAAEFAYIAREMPWIREVGIEDDLFTGDKKRLRKICELLIAQRNRLNFWCDTRVDLDYEDMRLLKEAGCRLLIAGFESASQEILDRIQKGTQAAEAFEFMDNARRVNLLVHGCFVLGNPHETRQTMQDTLQFAQKLNPDTAQFFPMMVYPGTKMYEWAETNGYLRTKNYNEWLTEEGCHNSIVDLPGLSSEEVLRFCDHARRQFYLRKGYLLRKIAQSLTSFQEARRNLKAFRRFARFLVNAS